MPGPEFSAIILAGGGAVRLGGLDKPGLEVGGRTLLASVVAAASDAGAGRIIVVGPDRQDLPVCFVREEPAGAGPVPALRRGLDELTDTDTGAEADRGQVAVLAADLPFLRVEHLRALRAAAAGRTGAILADDGGYPQWLTGCWHTATLARAVAGYTGSSLRGLMTPLDPARVRIEPGPGEPPPWLDCDTDADLRHARSALTRDDHVL